MKQLGLSYKKIGKKIGIDPIKEEVLAVYGCFCEHDPSLNPIESIKAAAKVHSPSPLWFLFDSELNVIANTAIPDPQLFLSDKLQLSINKRHASHMLETYLDVGEVLSEEMAAASKNANPSSPLGKQMQWMNTLPMQLIAKAWHIQWKIAENCYQLSGLGEGGVGRCRCTAIALFYVVRRSYSPCFIFPGLCILHKA